MEIPFKSLCQYDFRVVLILLNAVPHLGTRVKFNGVTVQMKPLQQYFRMVLFVFYVVLTFESVDEILWCCHSNEFSSVVLSHGAICFVHSSTFWNRGWNSMVLPFNWNLFDKPLPQYYLFLRILQIEILFFVTFSSATVRRGKRITTKGPARISCKLNVSACQMPGKGQLQERCQRWRQ